MNREQMIAWLTLEGYTPFRGRGYFINPGVYTDGRSCYVNDEGGHMVYWADFPGKHDLDKYTKDTCDFNVLTDAQLKWVYEAISSQVP